MTMTLIADAPVDVDAEGFLTDPEQWNEQIAEAIAAENGIPELTDRHWLVVRFMRDRYLATGTAPSIRSLGKESGVPDQGALPALPQGAGQARRQDRRHPQAQGLHLGRSDDDRATRTADRPSPPSRRRSRRSRSSSPRARSRASTPA